MSERYPGGIITKNPATPTGPYENGTAPGIWTLDQQLQYKQQGIWPTAGLTPNYIEDVFSTWLVTPTLSNTTYSVTNGIDVSGKGGMVWMKARSSSGNNLLYDTVRGASAGSNNALISNNTSGQQTANFDYITGLSNGFTVNYATGGGQLTNNGINYASWTFRKQAKFFDVLTYTGNGTAGRTVAHNLGSVPGFIVVKQTGGGSTGGVNNWFIYHRSLGGTKYMALDGTFAAVTSSSPWNNTDPTSTVFSIGGTSDCNDTGGTYVAYLFAHNAGGFGLTGTDNVISCGSFTDPASGSTTEVTLGYEPQWLLVKPNLNTTDWYLIDNMRGMVRGSSTRILNPNLSAAENNGFSNGYYQPTATGFTAGNTVTGGGGTQCIYIAIRRGPMKVPTDALTVFDVGTRAGSSSDAKTNSDILTDLAVIKRYTSSGEYWAWTPRLNGNLTLQSNSSDANLTGAMATNPWDTMTGAFCAASNGATNTSTLVDYSFRRAPGFHDVVCYTGDYSGNPQIAHNLTVAPELIIAKDGDNAGAWYTNSPLIGTTFQLGLSSSSAKSSGSTYTLTSTYFQNPDINYPTGSKHVAYLFATLAGISKVGIYTGTGALQTVNCGFTTGARFILIKRTDSSGDWYVWDSVNGISSGNDPYLLVNSTAAQVTGTNYVDTDTTGFKVTAAAPAAVNANGGTFLFLAIA
jgi:hypothetical protein